MRARFVKRKWENNIQTIASFYFRPESAYRYEAGQYAVITLPHNSPDTRGTSRTMTLSSSPTEKLLKFTMRLYGADGSSFKNALVGLQVDDEVTIYDAMGDLVLPLDLTIPLVFIAGGVGIASFVGMVQWLLDTKETRHIELLYAVAKPEDIIMQETFTSYAAQYPLSTQIYVSTAPSRLQIPHHTNHLRLTVDDIQPFITSDSLVYLSGPEAMVEQLRPNLIATKAASSQQIIFDYFDGYTTL